MSSADVANMLADLMDVVAEVSTLCSALEFTSAHADQLKDCTKRFVSILSRVQSTLDTQMRGVDADTLPMANNSFAQREELEVCVKERCSDGLNSQEVCVVRCP